VNDANKLHMMDINSTNPTRMNKTNMMLNSNYNPNQVYENQGQNNTIEEEVELY